MTPDKKSDGFLVGPLECFCSLSFGWRRCTDECVWHLLGQQAAALRVTAQRLQFQNIHSWFSYFSPHTRSFYPHICLVLYKPELWHNFVQKHISSSSLLYKSFTTSFKLILAFPAHSLTVCFTPPSLKVWFSAAACSSNKREELWKLSSINKCSTCENDEAFRSKRARYLL